MKCSILPKNEDKVCKLVKSIYGLKQPPNKWHNKFDLTIISLGFKHNSIDNVYIQNFMGIMLCFFDYTWMASWF